MNGAGTARTPNTTNIYFDGLEGEALVISLDLKGFAVSSGSACSSGAVEPSHVLLAMGLTPERARASLRFSLGHSNNEEQVDALIEAVAEIRRAVAQAFAHLYECLITQSRKVRSPSRCRAEWIAPSSRDCCSAAASRSSA